MSSVFGPGAIPPLSAYPAEGTANFSSPDTQDLANSDDDSPSPMRAQPACNPAYINCSQHTGSPCESSIPQGLMSHSCQIPNRRTRPSSWQRRRAACHARGRSHAEAEVKMAQCATRAAVPAQPIEQSCSSACRRPFDSNIGDGPDPGQTPSMVWLTQAPTETQQDSSATMPSHSHVGAAIATST